MKLIIDIPEEDYKFIKDLQFYHSGRRSGKTIERNVINGIRNGTPYEERPQGEWIGGEIGHCSICGSEGCASDIWNGCKDGMYCPNCGADMRGDKE